MILIDLLKNQFLVDQVTLMNPSSPPVTDRIAASPLHGLTTGKTVGRVINSHLPPVLTITVLSLTLLLSLALCGKDEAVQLATEEVPLLFQVLNSFLKPRVFLQRDLQLGPQVGDHHVGIVDWRWSSR